MNINKNKFDGNTSKSVIFPQPKEKFKLYDFCFEVNV